MRLFGIDIEDGLELTERVDTKYKPVFDKFAPEQRADLAWYFLPHKSQKEILGVTRPRVVKWYCPFANQKDFPSGHRYCINVYAGCSHKCEYCYAQGYEPDETKCKDNFKKKLLKDLSEIEEFNLPAAPLYLSNSTDALQPIEQQQKLTLYTLQQLPRYRKYFTSIVILTKNPSLLLEPQYLTALKELVKLPQGHSRKSFFDNNCEPTLRIEASLAFSNQADADFDDDGTVDNNFEGSVSAGSHYYAVWSSLNDTSECNLLREVGPDNYGATQRWVRTDDDTFWGATVEHLSGTEGYPTCP